MTDPVPPVRRRFGAPWPPSLRASTITAAVLLALVAAVSGLWGGLLALLALGAALGWAVRGYEVAGGELRILRFGWRRRLPLEGLRAVRAAPHATAEARRRRGISGVLGTIGAFESAALGPFTAFATDPARCVVVVLAERTVVVTPDDPDAFVQAVRREAGTPPAATDDEPAPFEPASEIEPPRWRASPLPSGDAFGVRVNA